MLNQGDLYSLKFSSGAQKTRKFHYTDACWNAEDFCVVCSFAEENADESMIEKVQCGLCSRWAHFECAQYAHENKAVYICKKCLKIK
ncbi:unnamed protein product [Arctogadus glacialis]